MDGTLIDIILFAALSLFLGYRLWLALGHKTGNERPPQQAEAYRRAEAEAAAAKNVVPLRPRGPVIDVEPTRGAPVPLQAGVQQIRSADRDFDLDRFCEGAKQAFGMIVKAFAEGDTASLRALVSDEVYDTFAEAIRHRLAARESVDTRIVQLDPPEPVDAHLDGRTAYVTLKFVSRQVTITRDAQGKLLDGDPERPIERTDFWTFARNTRSSSPNWALVGTGTPE